MKLHLMAAAVALAFATASFAQAPAAPSTNSPGGSTNRSAERDMKKAEHERIEAAYKADKAKCDAMKGNPKDVCMKEAKGKEKVAMAELDAKDDPSERNTRKVHEAKAEAEYDVAKEKCDAMKGKEKDACQHEAKAKLDQAKASLQGEKAASRGASSAPAKRGY